MKKLMKNPGRVILNSFIATLPPIGGLICFYLTEWHPLIGVAIGLFTASLVNNMKSGGVSSIAGTELVDDGGSADDGSSADDGGSNSSF